MATWILTASPENHEATAAHGFRVIGFKERRHRQALEVETGDRIVPYLTRVMRANPYPWRAALLLERMRARAGAPA
jgi:hypothetical protein